MTLLLYLLHRISFICSKKVVIREFSDLVMNWYKSYYIIPISDTEIVACWQVVIGSVMYLDYLFLSEESIG